MKYIRTKDGIIDYYEWRANEDNYKIVRDGDTIEELCDGFVFVSKKDKNITPYFTATLAVFDNVKSLLDTDDVYGAIWTDKGLIYVAKMKGILSNGEIDWELL